MKYLEYFYFSFIVIGLVLFQSPGFDFYSIGYIHYYYDAESLNKITLFGIDFPRYLAFSDILIVTRMLGIPSGYPITILIIIPLLYIINTDCRNKKLNLTCLYFIILVFFLSIKFSVLLLSSVWIFSFYISKRKIFLLGFFFHPAALIFVVLFFFLKIFCVKHIYNLLYIAIILFSLNLALGQFEVINYKQEAGRVVLLENVFNLLESSIRKIEFLFILLIGIFFSYYTRQVFFHRVFFYITPLFFLFSILFYILFFEKSTFFSSLFSNQYDYISITFLDFGQRDYNLNDFDNIWRLRDAHLYR